MITEEDEPRNSIIQSGRIFTGQQDTSLDGSNRQKTSIPNLSIVRPHAYEGNLGLHQKHDTSRHTQKIATQTGYPATLPREKVGKSHSSVDKIQSFS